MAYGYSALVAVRHPARELQEMIEQEALPGAYEFDYKIFVPLLREDGESWYWNPSESSEIAYIVPEAVCAEPRVNYFLQSEEVGIRSAFTSIPTTLDGGRMQMQFTNPASAMEEDWHSSTSYIATQMARICAQELTQNREEVTIDCASLGRCEQGRLIVAGKRLGSIISPIGNTAERIASLSCMSGWTKAFFALQSRQDCGGCDCPHYAQY